MGLVGAQLPLGQAADSAAVGGDPQRAVAVGKQRRNAGLPDAAAPFEGAEAPLAVLAQPSVVRANPQCAPGAHGQPPNRVIRQPIAGCEDPLDAAFDTVQPVIGAHPDGSRRVLQQDVNVGFEGALENPRAPPPLEPHQASVRARPQHAPRIHQHGTDIGVGQAQGFELLETSIAVAQQPVVQGADPQPSVRRQQRGQRTALQQRRIRAVEDREIHAIEASQPVDRRKPEIAVGGLCDGADRVVRQAVRGGPDVVAELRQSQLGIQSPGGDRHQGYC